MESDVVRMRGEHQVSSVPGAICCCFGTEQVASETPKVAIDALEFQNLDSEEDVCRICQESGNNSQWPLLHHCACKGSIGYVHKDCIEKWLELSRARECEICKQDYPFVIPTFPDRPEEAPVEYGSVLRLDVRNWFILTMWIMLSHIVAVFFTVPNGRSWVIDGLWGSGIYFLVVIGAYFIWLTIVFCVPAFMPDAYYTRPFMWNMYNESNTVRAAARNYPLPSNPFVEGVGDIGGTPFAYMLAYKLYNMVIDTGAAAYDEMTSHLVHKIAVWEDVNFGRPLIYEEDDHDSDIRKFKKAIIMILGLPVTGLVWCCILYLYSLPFVC